MRLIRKNESGRLTNSPERARRNLAKSCCPLRLDESPFKRCRRTRNAMSDPLFNVDLQYLDTTSAEIQNLLVEKLRDERGVRIEDAISGAAAVAGCSLLRSTGIPLNTLTAGAAVFVEDINELGPQYVGFLSGVCAAMGIDQKSGWNTPIPDDHKPIKSVIQLTYLLEQPFLDLCARLSVSNDLHARLALFTAARLIEVGKDILDPNVGKAIAVTSLVAGAKTIPHPIA